MAVCYVSTRLRFLSDIGRTRRILRQQQQQYGHAGEHMTFLTPSQDVDDNEVHLK